MLMFISNNMLPQNTNVITRRKSGDLTKGIAGKKETNKSFIVKLRMIRIMRRPEV